LPRLKMTKLSSLLLHPKWARDRAGHMPMVPTLVPSPILGALLPRQVAALGLEPAPVTLLAPDPVTKPGLAVVAVAAAPAPALVTLPALVPAVAEVALAAAISPARVPVALPALVPAISPAAVVGTDRQFGDE
jgi:hypothetical protein